MTVIDWSQVAIGNAMKLILCVDGAYFILFIVIKFISNSKVIWVNVILVGQREFKSGVPNRVPDWK